MARRFLSFTALCAAICLALPAGAAAQSIELVFTPGVLQQAVSLKGALKVDKVDSFSALALVGASGERKKAYADKVAGDTAVVILGEDALKAMAEVEFSVPIIVLNASGPTAAKGRVFRVYDGAAPAGATPVASSATVRGLLGGSHEIPLKGAAAPTIQAVLEAIR